MIWHGRVIKDKLYLRNALGHWSINIDLQTRFFEGEWWIAVRPIHQTTLNKIVTLPPLTCCFSVSPHLFGVIFHHGGLYDNNYSWFKDVDSLTLHSLSFGPSCMMSLHRFFVVSIFISFVNANVVYHADVTYYGGVSWNYRSLWSRNNKVWM